METPRKMVIQVTYGDDLQTQLLLAAIETRDAIDRADLEDRPELAVAVRRLADVIESIGNRMGMTAL